MEEKRKRHFKVGEAKTHILDFVLRQQTPVKEPEVTKYLKSIYSEFTRASVNRHFSDLEKLKCVTKVDMVKKSMFNYWDIEFKNLKNIKKEFSDIQLSNNTKAKDIIIEENFPDIQLSLYKKCSVFMSLFPSLFDTFLNNEFEPMLKRASELWEIKNYHDQEHKIHIIYSKICERFFETDFLLGKANDEAKQFVVKLEERIQKVNDAYNTTPSIENPRPVINFQAAVDELDALYDEWYEKCLKKDQVLLTIPS